MELSKLKYRDLILILSLEYDAINKFFKKSDKYRHLLNAMRKYTNSESGLPYQKNLLEELNMSRNKLMEFMHELYEDFQTKLCESKSYQISKTDIWLHVKSREDYWCIGLDNMEYLPNAGDKFTLEFVRGEFGGRNFKVENVSHTIENGVHKIHISMQDRWVSEGKTTW